MLSSFRNRKAVGLTIIAGLTVVAGVAIYLIVSGQKERSKRKIPVYNFEEKTQYDGDTPYTTITIESESMSYEMVKTIIENFEDYFNSYACNTSNTSDVSEDLPGKLYRELKTSCDIALAESDSYYQNLPKAILSQTDKNLEIGKDRLRLYPVWDTTAKCILWANTPYKKTNNAFKTVERIVIINSLQYAYIKERQRAAVKKEKG